MYNKIRGLYYAGTAVGSIVVTDPNFDSMNYALTGECNLR